MRVALVLLSVSGAAAFGGIEYLLNGGGFDQSAVPKDSKGRSGAYNVVTKTQK